MLDLLAGVPTRVWVLLALIVLVPVAASLTALYTPAGRRFGLAARITSRAVAMMGVGFALMALVATLAVLQTGLQEIRQRHLRAVVDLAAELSTGHARRPDSVSFGRTLSLFRALQPDAGPTAIWGTSCGTGCLSVAAEPSMKQQTEAWARGLIARPPAAGALRTSVLNGELHLVISGVLRDVAGAPEGHLAVAVRAGWVADRALRTALTLVALAYALLLVVGWATRGMLAATVASRVRDLSARLRGASPAEQDRPPPDAPDELAALDHVVGSHIMATVERLRDAGQRAAEARALAARMEATATLAAGVAHDFSNLMSGVMANCELLRLDVGHDADAAQTLDTIFECAQRGGDLAQQLVAFARGGRYRPLVIDLNALVRDTLRLEAHTLDPHITVEGDLAGDLLRVDADPTQLAQVIGNLHRNAVEALQGAGAEGTIIIRTRNLPADGRPPALADMPAGPYVVLSVEDTGPGMSEETRARIFEPFFTTKEGGRGMGLAATYGIVAHHGGQIDVDTKPGRGTTFTVYLPATSAPAVSLEARRSAGLATRSGTTVLVVDDEVPILSATRRLLERRGYRVLTAEGGAEAVQLAQNATTPIDVAVLDLRMPGMSGAETFGPLVAAHPRIRVILGSGYDLDEDARALLGRGAVDFVRKPFSVDALGAAIERALGRSAQPS